MEVVTERQINTHAMISAACIHAAGVFGTLVAHEAFVLPAETSIWLGILAAALTLAARSLDFGMELAGRVPASSTRCSASERSS